MILVQLLSASVLIPAFIGTVHFLSLPDHGKMFVWFIYATLISEIVSIILAYAVGNNMIVFYFYSSAVALCIGVAYSKIMDRNLKIFYLVPIAAIVESIFSGYRTFNSFSFTILNILTIIIVLISYYYMIEGKVKEDVYYFNAALMFGAMTNILCYFTAFFLQKYDVGLMKSLFGFHNWTNMVTNLGYAYSLWILSKSSYTAR